MHQFTDYHELLHAYPEYNTMIAKEKKSDSADEMPENSQLHRTISSLSTKVLSIFSCGTKKFHVVFFLQIFPDFLFFFRADQVKSQELMTEKIQMILMHRGMVSMSIHLAEQ